MKEQNYSPEIIARCKAEYESGAYSVEKLPCRVSVGIASRTVERWIQLYGWEKGRLRTEIEKRHENEMVERFSRLGMPTDEAVKLMIRGMYAGEDIAERIMQKLNEQVGSTDGSPTAATLKDFIEMLTSYGTDLKTRAKFLELYFHVTGQVQAPREQSNDPMKKPKDFSKFSAEELRLWATLMEKSTATAASNG